MIPAVLSCVFVIYLYHTLNQPSAGTNPTSVSSNEQQQALVAKLASLQTRLDALGRASQMGGRDS